MKIIFGEIANTSIFDCSGYNDSCWCNDVACQGQED